MRIHPDLKATHRGARGTRTYPETEKRAAVQALERTIERCSIKPLPVADEWEWDEHGMIKF